MGRSPLNVGRLTFRIGRELPERMTAVLRPGENWADLVRDAVEAEVRRREKAVIEAEINAEIKRRESAAKRNKPTK
jgi:predicted ATP-grasp superfamily ATP-dependent carboligase